MLLAPVSLCLRAILPLPLESKLLNPKLRVVTKAALLKGSLDSSSWVIFFDNSILDSDFGVYSTHTRMCVLKLAWIAHKMVSECPPTPSRHSCTFPDPKKQIKGREETLKSQMTIAKDRTGQDAKVLVKDAKVLLIDAGIQIDDYVDSRYQDFCCDEDDHCTQISKRGATGGARGQRIGEGNETYQSIPTPRHAFYFPVRGALLVDLYTRLD